MAGSMKQLLGSAIRIAHEDQQGRILTFDSATFVPGFYEEMHQQADKDVVVTASYNGVLCARMVARAKPKAVIGLDCAIGKDGAGIAGLWFYEALGIPSVAVDVQTAEMGNGADLLAEGVVSRVNEIAREMGLREGMTTREAAQLFLQAETGAAPENFTDKENRAVILTNPQGRSIVCTDSIAFARPEDRERNVLCTAGHTGRSVIDYIINSRPWGFICSDGGIGKNESGLQALPVVNAAGIAGASVSALTARMGDGHSTYFDGVISACNDLAKAKGVKPGQTAKEAALLLLNN